MYKLHARFNVSIKTRVAQKALL